MQVLLVIHISSLCSLRQNHYCHPKMCISFFAKNKTLSDILWPQKLQQHSISAFAQKKWQPALCLAQSSDSITPVGNFQIAVTHPTQSLRGTKQSRNNHLHTPSMPPIIMQDCFVPRKGH